MNWSAKFETTKKGYKIAHVDEQVVNDHQLCIQTFIDHNEWQMQNPEKFGVE